MQVFKAVGLRGNNLAQRNKTKTTYKTQRKLPTFNDEAAWPSSQDTYRITGRTQQRVVQRSRKNQCSTPEGTRPDHDSQQMWPTYE